MGLLAGKIALVTGATHGIGRAAALAAAREGAHVIAVARSVGHLEALDDEIRSLAGAATLVSLDLRKGELVDALGPSLYPRWDRIDALVAAAGVLGSLSPLPHVTTATWDEVIEVNLSANWRLIRTLEPLLRRAEAGRAVFLTCGAATAQDPYWGPYAASKAGLEALVKTWALELADSRVRVNLLDPGPVRTALRAKAFPGERPDTLPPPEALTGLILDLLGPKTIATGVTVVFDREATAGG